VTFVHFWNLHKAKLSALLPVVRLYASMPTSSVKPESVFSYTGRLVSKRASAWGVGSVEAQSIINDFTRQDDWNFQLVLEGVEAMAAEWKKRKRESKRLELEAKSAVLEAKAKALRAELDEIELSAVSSEADESSG